jgi:hypothetical protein
MTILIIGFGIVIFLSAYCLGKNQGCKAGIREGRASMLLELREQSLIEGCCFFCGAKKRSILSKNTKEEDTEGLV